jgi:hypothetical protein
MVQHARELGGFEESRTRIVFLERDVRLVEQLAGLHRETEHSLQNRQFAIDFGVRDDSNSSTLFWSF